MANYQIRKINVDRGTIHVVAKTPTFPANAYLSSMCVSNNGTLYIADAYNDCIYKLYEDGRLLGCLASVLGGAGDAQATGMLAQPGSVARFYMPFAICVDASDNIYVNDSYNGKIKHVSPSGRVITLAGGTFGDRVGNVGTDAKFSPYTYGICVDKAGIIYCCDQYFSKIKKIWPSGKSTTLAGGPGGAGVAGFANGLGNDARFNGPTGVTVDAHGTVYVADRVNNRIRKIDEAGNVTTLAGNGTYGLVDGEGAISQFALPRKIAMDPGNQFMYVMEGTSNSSIRRVTTSGKVTTVMHYNVPAVLFGDICVDKSGFLYILENVV